MGMGRTELTILALPPVVGGLPAPVVVQLKPVVVDPPHGRPAAAVAVYSVAVTVTTAMVAAAAAAVVVVLALMDPLVPQAAAVASAAVPAAQA